VKMRPLPEIDLARIAPLNDAAQRKELTKFCRGKPHTSYAPFHKVKGDTLNVTPGPLVGIGKQADWSIIENSIRLSAKAGNEFADNIGVAKALHDFSAEHGIVGRRHDFRPLHIGIGLTLKFWHSSVLNIQGRRVVPFFDPRRKTTSLSNLGRKFVFSVMHEHIRVGNPDYEGVELGIFQFDSAPNGTRKVRLFYDDGSDHYSATDLAQMIERTLGLYREAWAEHQAAQRSKSKRSVGFL